jgi:RND superfamily putative drug exporter
VALVTLCGIGHGLRETVLYHRAVARWTRFVIRNRKKFLLAWVMVLVLGGTAAAGLGNLLTNHFAVPGAESQKGADLIEKRMKDREAGAFTLIFQVSRGSSTDPVFVRSADAAAQRAAAVIKNAKAGPLIQAGHGVAYMQITTPLEFSDAQDKTSAVRKAIGNVSGARSYLSGFPAINHDTEPISNNDLARGERIALPIAILVLAFMFGTLAGIAVPLAFALFTIPTALGIVWIFAHFMDMPIYVQNMATLIGIAIAIDYSMLVVFRYREELARTEDAHEALVKTMRTSGRATIFSGMTVALGLALLVVMPLPFMRAMGLGGLIVPLVSIAAAATLLPALLAVMGRKLNRLRFIPRRVLEKRARAESGIWARLARSIMRRPVLYLAATVGVMLALAYPATQLHITGGDNRSLPSGTEAVDGLKLLERTLGPGALSPQQVVVDTKARDGAWSPSSLAAQRRLIAELRRDPEIQASTIQAPALLVRRPGAPDAAVLARARRANLVDPASQILQVRAAGTSDVGTTAATDLVHRIRDRYVPQANFGSAEVFVSGQAAFNVDFIHKAYTAFPWLVLAVLVLTYLILLRAFRSVVLPIKAVLMNLLSVAATYGLLVLVFQHHWGKVLGFEQTPQIEAWIPIFLFAILFGLSMDYEVFLLSRMREEWDARHHNESAVAFGLERTGRIITACAIIMIAAFSGFFAGSFVWSQEFGTGLAGAILIDATIVRALLVPAAMKLIGDWNWYLPERVRRAMRLTARPATVE